MKMKILVVTLVTILGNIVSRVAAQLGNSYASASVPSEQSFKDPNLSAKEVYIENMPRDHIKPFSRHPRQYWTVGVQKMESDRIWRPSIPCSAEVNVCDKYILIGTHCYPLTQGTITFHEPDRIMYLTKDCDPVCCAIIFIPPKRDSLKVDMVLELDYSTPKPIGNGMMKATTDSAYRYFLVKKLK